MRQSERKRKTEETDVLAKVDLDGDGKCHIATGIGFFNHMLELFAKHGKLDLSLEGRGDLDVDMHHTVEDVGIVLGSVLNEALGDKKGIERYGDILLPMDETLVQVALDLSGRSYLVFQAPDNFKGSIGRFDTELVLEFLTAFTNNLKANIHVRVLYGNNKHHIAEGIFKGLARAFSKAAKITGDEIPSTKGVLQ